MALAGNVGAILDRKLPFDDIARSLFAEDQGLYVATVEDTALIDFLANAHQAGVEVERIGRTAGSRLIFEREDGDFVVALDALRRAHEGFFPGLMGADAALA